MNKLEFVSLKESIFHHLRLRVRHLDRKRQVQSFSAEPISGTLQRVYVINLDRRPDRWKRVRRELERFSDRDGKRLSSITRRFSAIDARYMNPSPDRSVLIPEYSLADQLTVDPNPFLHIDSSTRSRVIEMTRQEIAVALSHIEVWKLIAQGDVPSVLVLEDDVFMERGFASGFDKAWTSLGDLRDAPDNFDLLFLAFETVGETGSVNVGRGLNQLRGPGIWEASGYVLTQEGAKKLLEALPVYGPVDLWLNLQFEKLRTYTTTRRVISQRIDEPSTNAYSVLPVLSQVGVITREKPLLPDSKNLPGPVFAIGDPDTGLSSLAAALSMLGYTCASDLRELPKAEAEAVLRGQRNRTFSAYVNIGSMGERELKRIAENLPNARFISTSPGHHLPSKARHTLFLYPDTQDPWAKLTDFLDQDYPSWAYPALSERGQRVIAEYSSRKEFDSINLKFDRSPWIVVDPSVLQGGITLKTDTSLSDMEADRISWVASAPLNRRDWLLRDDTFPSNLALFTSENFTIIDNEAHLEFRRESTSVRDFTSAAIASTQSYLYGVVRAEMRPPRVTGLVTGLFLHRNGPRQEIDIEFLGKDTTKMLVNVFYNPGTEGTKLEYGYRGTPTLIDLGFDASEDFHYYEIEWTPCAIRWRVDGKLVYERTLWNPTPIPDQPLQVNVNLWHSRSREFAGKLDETELPTSASIRSLEIAQPVQISSS